MTKVDPSALPYRPCVGIVLMNEAGKVFVGERIDTPDAWQMPQGGIDADEAHRDAALRELWEETGVEASAVEIIAETSDWLTYDLPEALLGKAWKGKYRGQKQLWVLMRFSGTDADIKIDTDHPEFSKWKWSDSASLVDNIVPFKRHIYDSVVRAFSQYLT